MDGPSLLLPEFTNYGRLLGAGAFGQVRKAVVQCVRFAAVKQATSVIAAHSLWREHQVSLRLGAHPHLLPVEAIDSPMRGVAFELAFPVCEGGSLEQLMRKQIPERNAIAAQEGYELSDLPILGPHIFLPAILGLLKALQHSHSRGIVHMDVKPENVIFRHDEDYDSAKLIDFGLALHLGQKIKGPHGTPGFRAPEIDALAEAGAEAVGAHPSQDVFGVGKLCFRSLRGFRADDVRAEANTFGMWVARAYGLEIATVLCAALCHDPQQRPSIAAMIDVFQMQHERLRQSVPAAKPKAPPTPGKLARARVKRSSSAPARPAGTFPARTAKQGAQDEVPPGAAAEGSLARALLVADALAAARAAGDAPELPFDLTASVIDRLAADSAAPTVEAPAAADAGAGVAPAAGRLTLADLEPGVLRALDMPDDVVFLHEDRALQLAEYSLGSAASDETGSAASMWSAAFRAGPQAARASPCAAGGTDDSASGTGDYTEMLEDPDGLWLAAACTDTASLPMPPRAADDAAMAQELRPSRVERVDEAEADGCVRAVQLRLAELEAARKLLRRDVAVRGAKKARQRRRRAKQRQAIDEEAAHLKRKILSAAARVRPPGRPQVRISREAPHAAGLASDGDGSAGTEVADDGWRVGSALAPSTGGVGAMPESPMLPPWEFEHAGAAPAEHVLKQSQ